MSAYWITLLTVLMALEAPKTPEEAAKALHREGAVGVLQIRPIYLQDVNERCTKAVLVKYGRLLTMDDMKDEAIARWTAQQYLISWGKYYSKKTGKIATTEVLARMHNGGGLAGWKYKATTTYWERFQKECRSRGIDPIILK